MNEPNACSHAVPRHAPRRSTDEVAHLIDRFSTLVAEERRPADSPAVKPQVVRGREIECLQHRLAIAVRRDLSR
jgi:hypothetical protein